LPFTPKFVDLVRCTTTSTGTGALTLGAAVAGYAGFTETLNVGDQFYYCVQGVDKPAEREVGRGTLEAGGKLGREAIGGALTNFTVGTKTVALVASAEWYAKVEQGGAGGGGQSSVATRALLAAAPTGGPVYLTEAGREGLFLFKTGDYSAMVAADPEQAVFVAPASDPDGSSGAWVRQHEGPLQIGWFGGREIAPADYGIVANHPTYDIKPALDAFEALARAATTNNVRGLGAIHLPGRAYYCSHKQWTFPVEISGKLPSAEAISFPTYVRGPQNADLWTFNRHNTLNGGSVAPASHAGADGSVIRGIHFLGANSRPTTGGWYGASGILSPTGRGIWARCRITVEHCVFTAFGSHGVEVLAYAGAGGGVEGNANSCKFVDCVFSQNGGVGLRIEGADANVAWSYACRYYGNRLGGLWDLSFLGGGQHQVETDDNGRNDYSGNGRKSGFRAHLGKAYTVRRGQEAGAATNAPSGTTADNAWWAYIGADVGYPAWTSGEAVEFSADVLTDFGWKSLTVYVEGSSAPINLARGTIMTGAVTSRVLGEGIYLASGGDGLLATMVSGNSGGADFASLGNLADPAVAMSFSYNQGTARLNMTRAAGCYGWGYPGMGELMRWYQPGHATYPRVFTPAKLALSRWNDANTHHRFGYVASLADLAGETVAQGDFFFAAASGVGGRLGWYCTTGGTVGSGAVLTEVGTVGRKVTTISGAAHTAALADVDGYLRFTNAGAVTLTIPANADAAFPVGAELHLVQAGAGTVTIAPASGVTVNSHGGDLSLAGPHAAATVKKVAANEWDAIGKFA
jgi:hypothetical protein